MPETRRRLADKGTEKRPWGWNEVGNCREMDPGRLEKSLPSWARLLPVALDLRGSLSAPITLRSGATWSCELYFLSSPLSYPEGFGGSDGRNLPAVQESQFWSLDQEDPLEEEMATHASILDWRIPWTEEPDGLQTMGSQRVGHNWVINIQAILKALWLRKEPRFGNTNRHLNTATLEEIVIYTQ